MRRSVGSTIDPVVFWISLLISILFVLWGVLFTDNLAAVASAVLGWLTASFGWVFILASFGFLAFSRYGRIRLGGDDEPEFRTTSWVAKIFSAGMGIGLCWSLFKELRSEALPGVAPEPERAAVRPTGAAAPQQSSALDSESGG